MFGKLRRYFDETSALKSSLLLATTADDERRRVQNANWLRVVSY